MSKVVKAVKKVFKKVAKVVKKVVKAVKKIAKPLLIAAAVYFTAGVALGAFGSAGFVSGLPGWGAGGIFSNMAGSLGTWTGFAQGGALAGAGAGAAAGAAAGEAAAGAAAGEAAVAGGSVEGLTSAATQSLAKDAAAGLSNAATSGSMSVGAGGGGGAGGGAFSSVGNFAKATGTFMKDHPYLTMMAGQGVASVAKANAAREIAEEENDLYEAERDRGGVFGHSYDGKTVIDMPTVSNIEIDKPAAPQVGDPSGFLPSAQRPTMAQQQQPQQAGPVQMTPQQVMAAQQNQQIVKPRGSV